MNLNSSSAAATSRDGTRRSFMKKSALSIGALTLLGQGLAHAGDTSKCGAVNRNGDKVHTSMCEVVTKVKVTFNHVETPNPADGSSEATGRVFTGTLVYTVQSYFADGTSVGDAQDYNVGVTTGGFYDSDILAQGPTSDSAYTPGNYKLTLLPDGDIDGFSLVTMPPDRVALEIHYKIRDTLGSSGCIVWVEGQAKPSNVTLAQWKDPVDKPDTWKAFDRLMRQTRTCIRTTNKTGGVPFVPLQVIYEGVTAPNYIKK